MQLDDWIQKEPQQFEYFHRMMGYIMLSVVLVVFHYTEPDTQYQLFVPFFLFLVLLIIPKLSRWLIYRHDYHIRRNILFLIDVIVISVVLAAVHLDLVLSLLGLVAVLYTAISNKISFMMASLASLIGITLFYLANILVFGFNNYFEPTSSELTILGFICLITYFGAGSFYQSGRVQYMTQKKDITDCP